MIEPSIPADDASRLRALRALRILDTPPDERFDRITRLAAQIFNVRTSVISLVDEKRQWFKSRHGLDASETPRSVSFCGHTILQDEVFHVPDASLDARFADNPLVVGHPNIRFYAGMPLRAPGGQALGTLCLIDTQARDFSAADRALLAELASWAQDVLIATGPQAILKEKLRPWLGIKFTAMAVGLIELVSSQWNYIPNPPALLVLAVVFAAFYGGLASGLASALIACLYFAYFFSIPGQPFHYAGDNLARVLIWAVATPGIAAMVGVLQRRAQRLLETKIGSAVAVEQLVQLSSANSELRKSHEQLNHVMENIPMFVAFYDETRRCRYANEAYATWLGLELPQMLGKTAAEIFVSQAIPASEFEDMYARVFAGERIELEREHHHADGRVSHLVVVLAPQFNGPGRVSGYYSFTNDVTELKKATAENKRIAERLSLAIGGSNLSAWDWNMQDGTIYLDPIWSRMLGIDVQEMTIGVAELFDLVHPDDRELVYTEWQMVLKAVKEYYAVEHRVKTRSGEWLWISSRGKVVERDAGNMALRMTGTNADISERKRAEAQIEILATTDPLTSLPNRRVLADRISHAMLNAGRAEGTLFALLFIDLDRFKVINDSIGHNLGDQLLQLVAARIAGVIRQGDTLARLGGDEFAVVLERLHESAEAGEVTQKIIAAFSAPYLVEGHSLEISCSVGISLFPGDASDATSLLRDADQAMYAAKESGRGTYRYYSSEMNDRATERQSLERALRDALRDEQFEIHYQPKFSFHTGELSGVEALLRWQHPVQGQVSPTRFIPIAEETRLILPIGEWVLRCACSQVMKWAHQGYRKMSLAVNLSVIQINAGLPQTIDRVLRESAMEADLLEIEITENVLLRDADENINILRQVSGQGVHVAIDDFGTGYSSLSYLRRFKLNTIKIDQSFVRHMLDNENDASIVRAIIALAHSLKMIVVAEGVESLEQKNALREMGCDEWQGYLSSKPLAADQFEKRFLLESATT